jgi:tRNA A-37 threonylcarbamoyl transferase component Bud32
MSQGLEGLLTGHTLVKRYKIEEVCGRGGFAVVYRATDTRLGRPVAVKVITLTAEDPEQREVLRQRLHREARAAASLPHHPNLVTVHDVGTDPELGLDFLVMELLQGENLSQALQRERLPLSRALGILRDAAEGLAIGHRAGLVHRDVKPGNIFLARAHNDDPEAYRVCLLDYGIAMAIEDDQTVTRGMGNNPLSPAFASPEQLAGRRDLSPATDVFSLGVVGYQLLTGERPFTTEPGQMPTGWTVRTPIRELNPEVSPAVEEVVMRAMAVDPHDRYPNADLFAEALDVAMGADDVTQGLAAKAHSPGVGALVLDEELEDDSTMIAPAPAVVAAPAAAAPAAAPHRPVPPLRPPSHDRPRKRSKMPVVLVIALLLVAAAAWAAMSGRGGGSDRGAEGGSAAPGDTVGGETAGTVVDDAGNPVEPGIPARTGEDVDVPVGSTPSGGGEPAGPSGSAPSASAPSGGAPSSGAPGTGAPNQPSQPAGQQPQPQPQQPTAQPQPQPQRPPVQQQPPAARPPAQQPGSPPAQQPSPPPAQQPQPQPQPQRPPVQQPPPAQPQQPQPRPEPPLLGRPIEPRPDAPRDTIFIGNPGVRR